MNLKISIIIPTYNRAHLIGETLDSIAAQTYQDWECIVVDDGSTDNTGDVVNAFAKADQRFSYYKRPENLPKGANACRNYGFEKSNGDFIKWFDSDDVLLASNLEKQITVFKKLPKLDLCLCRYQSFTVKDNKKFFSRIYKLESSDFLNDLIIQKFFIQMGCGLWKKSFLLNNTFKIFDESLTQSQDYDFYVKFLNQNPKISIIEEILFYLRRGNYSISSQHLGGTIQHKRSYLEVRKKIILGCYDLSVKIFIYNKILKSLNYAVQNMDKEFVNLLFIFLNETKNIFNFYQRLKIVAIIKLSMFLMFTGKGAFFLRSFFLINNKVS